MADVPTVQLRPTYKNSNQRLSRAGEARVFSIFSCFTR